MNETPTDLNVCGPHLVAPVLRAAAEAYRLSADDLTASWQDPSAGAPWRKIATILERAAGSIDRIKEIHPC